MINMATTPPSSKDLTIAWAAQVSLPQLVSSLEAYPDTKKAINAFRAALKVHMPEEVLCCISDKFRDILIRQNMKEWVKLLNCLHNDCCTEYHLTNKDIDYLQSLEGCNHHAELADHAFGPYADKVHERTAESLYTALMTPEKSVFEDCLREFTSEFGIRPYFILEKIYDEHAGTTKRASKAYLALPVHDASMSSHRCPHDATYAVNSVIDYSSSTLSTGTHTQRLKWAAYVLDLHAYDEHEDESIYWDLPPKRSGGNERCMCCKSSRSQTRNERSNNADGEDQEDNAADRSRAAMGTRGAKYESLASSGGEPERHGGGKQIISKPPESKTGITIKHKGLDIQLMLLGCGKLG